MMKVTILGCGGSTGVPMIGGQEGIGRSGLWGQCDPHNPRNVRTRSSLVVEHEGFRLLIDSGPDFRHQMLSAGLSHIDGVLYTHVHSDHVAGLDELRAINRLLGRPIPLLATDDVLESLKTRFNYAFIPWEGGGFYRPSFDVQTVQIGQPFHVGPLTGTSIAQRHGRLDSLGVRLGSFAYCTDVEHFHNGLDDLHGLDVWVVGCLQYKPHPAHAWLERVLEWRDQIKPKRTILTHMGPEMDYDTLKKTLPQGVEPAWDGMTLTV